MNNTATGASAASPLPTGLAQLGLVTLIGLVIANMIGIGVFTSSGFSLAVLGSPGQVMLAWILCGIWAISGAVAYGGLVSRLPMSGGEYLFLSRFVHPSVGFLAGWVSLLAGFTAPIALAAKGAAVHWLVDASSDDPSVAWLAAGLIATAALCHVLGVHPGTRVQNGIIAVKLLLLLVLIAVGYLGSAAGDWQGGPLPGRPAQGWPVGGAGWWTLIGSMSWIALSYTGFNAAVYVAAESPAASRQVPRALLWGTGLVTLIYLLLNYLFVYVPDPQSLVDSQGQAREEVAMIAARAIGGPGLAQLVRLTIILSMVSSVFAMLMLGPRVYRQMSVDGVMPPLFRGQDFRLAIAVQCGLSILAVFTGNLLSLMTYLGLTLSACGALAVGSLWWVRRRLPDSRPLSLPEHLAVLIYVGLSTAMIAAAYQQRSQQFQAMVWTFAAGIAVYLAGRYLRKFRP